MMIDPKTSPTNYNANLPAVSPQVIFANVLVPLKFSSGARGSPLDPLELLQQINTVRLTIARASAGSQAAAVDKVMDITSKLTSFTIFFYGCLLLSDDADLGGKVGELGSGLMRYNAFTVSEKYAAATGACDSLAQVVEQILSILKAMDTADISCTPAKVGELSLLARSVFVGTQGMEVQEDIDTFSVLSDSTDLVVIPINREIDLYNTFSPIGTQILKLAREAARLLDKFGASRRSESVAEKETLLAQIPVRVPHPPNIFAKCKFTLTFFLGDLHPGSPVGKVSLLPKVTKWCRVETWETVPSSQEEGATVIDSPQTSAQGNFESSLVDRLGSPFQEGAAPAFFFGTPAKVAQGISASVLAHVEAANAVRKFRFAEIPPNAAFAGMKDKAQPGIIFLKTENPLSSDYQVSYISVLRDINYAVTLAGIFVTFSNGIRVQDFPFAGLDDIAPLLATPGEMVRLKKKLTSIATVSDYVRRRLNFLQPPTGERFPAPYFVYTREVQMSPAAAKVAAVWDPFLKRAKIPGVVMRAGQTQLVQPLVVRGDFDFKRGSDFQHVVRVPAGGLDFGRMATE